jgi:hypothetical protein
MVLVLLLGAALLGVVQALLRTQSDDGPSALIKQASRSAGRERDAEQALQGDLDGPAVRKPILAAAGMGAMLAYVAGLPFLGYVVSTFLLLLAIMLLAGYRRPLSAVLIALLGTFAFFFVFQRIAYISLPLGTGIFRQFSTTLMALIGVR